MFKGRTGFLHQLEWYPSPKSFKCLWGDFTLWIDPGLFHIYIIILGAFRSANTLCGNSYDSAWWYWNNVTSPRCQDNGAVYHVRGVYFRFKLWVVQLGCSCRCFYLEFDDVLVGSGITATQYELHGLQQGLKRLGIASVVQLDLGEVMCLLGRVGTLDGEDDTAIDHWRRRRGSGSRPGTGGAVLLRAFFLWRRWRRWWCHDRRITRPCKTWSPSGGWSSSLALNRICCPGSRGLMIRRRDGDAVFGIWWRHASDIYQYTSYLNNYYGPTKFNTALKITLQAH